MICCPKRIFLNSLSVLTIDTTTHVQWLYIVFELVHICSIGQLTFFDVRTLDYVDRPFASGASASAECSLEKCVRIMH